MWRLICILAYLALTGCIGGPYFEDKTVVELRHWELLPEGTVFETGELQAGMDAARASQYEDALAILAPLAEQGDPIAQTMVGYLVYAGYAGRGDSEKAARLYRKAAEQGYATAQKVVEIAYAEGVGVPQNHAEAQRLLKLAAKQGSAGAARYLEYWYGDLERTKYLTLIYRHPECTTNRELPQCLLDTPFGYWTI